jgi:hypothetical protein
MGHDDWQRLLLSNSTSIRLHLFLSYCVCLPLNLTRQRLSILRGSRARVQSRSEDERRERASDGHSNWFQTKLFTHWEGKDDPIQLTWWQLDVGFCLFFFTLTSVLFFLPFSFWIEGVSQVDFLSFFFFFFQIRKQIRPPLRFFGRWLSFFSFFFYLEFASSPLFLET